MSKQPNLDIPLQALLKRFALIYLPVVIILSIILILSIRFEQQLQVRDTEVREGSRIEIAKERITQDMLAVDTDLRVIANLALLQRYLNSGNPKLRTELENYFLVLSRETHRYDQIRYLDASGQEVVRVDFNAGKPVIVSHEQLQNKSGRYYFNDTIKLGQDNIFVSPMDLNIEHGSLEIPYKPMVRYGTPVFDRSGHKKGIILLNYFGNELLKDFRAVMQGGIQHSSMLLNRDGFWLSSANREDEWGFMLGRNERTFGHDFPEAWRTISAAKKGYLLTQNGLFVYTTAYPLLDGHHSSSGSNLAHASSQQDVMTHEYNWKIVSFIPDEILSSAAFYNQPLFRELLAVVYLLLALAAFLVARIALS